MTTDHTAKARELFDAWGWALPQIGELATALRETAAAERAECAAACRSVRSDMMREAKEDPDDHDLVARAFGAHLCDQAIRARSDSEAK